MDNLNDSAREQVERAQREDREGKQDVFRQITTTKSTWRGGSATTAKQHVKGQQKKVPDQSRDKTPPKVEEDSQMYLDADDNHIKGQQMKDVIERKNQHKIIYLTNENTNIKQLLEDATKNIDINKNMI